MQIAGKMKKGLPNTDPFEDLAQAVIVQAVQDYRRGLRRLDRTEQKYRNLLQWCTRSDRLYNARLNVLDAQATLTDIEGFFRSQWFGTLTKVDPERLLQEVRNRG
ncbi:hypothetical protein [Eubacterium pyruvativorans]|uniref:hypothetical protein n=1 Tax=Eubacterium pyruvativorans TaxID=155865 RepID=UPI003F89ABF8